MTTIEDKIRKLDYEDKVPDIKPTLKKTMFDFHPDNSKKFKLEHTKEFDRDFKDGKAKSFKEDTNIKMFGDSKYKHFTANKAKDPFEKLFGYKHTDRPNRFLDGYYEFNMKGKDNTFYMKDNLLREQGVITDLEARLQAKEEFMEQYHVRQEGAKRIESETERIFNEEEADRAADADEGKEPETIQVEKAQRRQQIEDDVVEEISAEVEDILESIKKQKELPEKHVDKVNKRFDDFLVPKNRTPATRKGMNNLIKELKKGLGINVKQITIPMKEADITKTINDAKEKFNNAIEAERNKAAVNIQKKVRKFIKPRKVIAKVDEKVRQQEALNREGVNKTKAIATQLKTQYIDKKASFKDPMLTGTRRKPRTTGPEVAAREREAMLQQQARESEALARARALRTGRRSSDPPAPDLPIPPPQPPTTTQTTATDSIATDAIWADADASLVDLKVPITKLIAELERSSQNPDTTKIDPKYIDSLNKVYSLIAMVDSIDGKLRTRAGAATTVGKSIRMLKAADNYRERGSPQKPQQQVQTRGSTAAAGGGAAGGPG